MISHIDHVVLTVRDIDKSIEFFTSTLGMSPVTYSNGRRAVTFANQKISFNLVGEEVRNHALEGSGDLCLIASVSIEQMLSHLAALDVEVLDGPVEKTGAQGEMQSIYINDLDNNLIEIGFYPEQVQMNITENQTEKKQEKPQKNTAKTQKSTASKNSKPKQKRSASKAKATNK